MKITRSLELYKQAEERIAGQTQLLSRHPRLHAFGVSPIYAERAEGCRFWDVDGNEFIDMVGGTGVIYLGYCHPEVDAAAIAQIRKGIAYPINSPRELELAALLRDAVPCAEMVRYAKGGGDADAVAIRIARACTGRDKVLFCGYHGWCDWYIAANLADEGGLSAHLMPGVPCAGVPKGLTGTAIPFAYNDVADLKAKLEGNRGQVAAVIMEAARSAQPNPGYLEAVRKLCTEHGAVLIFDEVVTGFRYALGGAQQYFGVIPDMATFGKAIGNGYPIAAVAGKKEVMQAVQSSFVSSSYWSEPASMAAAIAIQNVIRRDKIVERIWDLGRRYQEGIRKIARDAGLPLAVKGLPPVFSVAIEVADPAPYNTLFTQEMTKRGVHAFAGVYIMAAHTPEIIDEVLRRYGEVARILKQAVQRGSVEGLLEVPVAKPLFRRRLV
jgi:glutamate-1-semialdehyde 2,1-aminomutase